MAPGVVQQIPCESCGQMSVPTRRFCGACGSRLWEPCLQCGVQNSIAERFCSQCGGDMKAALDRAAEMLEARMARSAVLEEAGELLEAAESLVGLPESDHSQLAPRLEAASARRAVLVSKREQVVAQRAAIVEQALRLRDERRYVAAHAELQQVPSSLRDQQMRTLLAELAGILQQIRDLRSRLRESLKGGQIDEMVSLAERLLRLEPGAHDVGRIYQQLCQRRDQRDAVLAVRLLKLAREAIGGSDYARAEACLAKISDIAAGKLDDEQRTLLAAIEERVWLARQLRIARYADKTALKLAARLIKLQPQDDASRKLHDEMASRLAGAQGRVQPVYVPWKRQKSASTLGAPVEPVGELAELNWEGGNAQLQSWLATTRRHLVAAGLALHGVGAARLDLELKRKDGASWLNRLTDARRCRAGSAAWGLDFGTTGLKVVRLAREKDSILVTCTEIIPYDGPDGGNGVPDVQPSFAAALAKFLEQFSPGNEPLVVGFPGAQSLGRFFRLPGTDAKKVQAALEFEIANQVPLPLDQVAHSTQFWKPGGGNDVREWPVTLVAAKKTHVDLRVGPFAESRARVASLQSDCVALLNLMLHCCRSQVEAIGPDDALVWVEVGDVTTNIVAVSPEKGPWFRTVYRGVRSLNALLVAAFGMTWQQADMLRRDWSTAPLMAEVDKVLAAGFEQLTRDVRQALTCCTQALECRVHSIGVAGGGCEQFGLLRDWALASERDAAAAGAVPNNSGSATSAAAASSVGASPNDA